MADTGVVDDPILDLPKKKKKKKTKTEDDVEQEEQEQAGEPVLELPSKKKKKKPKAEDFDDAEPEGLTEIAEEANSLFEALEKPTKKKPTMTEEELSDFLDSLEIDDAIEALIEKLQQSSGKDLTGDEDEEDGDDAIEFMDDEGGAEGWLGSDRDYKYSELLHRVFGMLRAKNPELSEGRRKHKMKPPQVMKDGTKKTVFANFAEICKNMNRNPEHVLAYMFTELGTSGSVDGNERLVIKGRFLPKSIETVLRRYITEYVVCSMCRSLDTTLARDPNTRLFGLHCSACGASRTVSAIKAGYQAQVGKRRK